MLVVKQRQHHKGLRTEPDMFYDVMMYDDKIAVHLQCCPKISTKLHATLHACTNKGLNQ